MAFFSHRGNYQLKVNPFHVPSPVENPPFRRPSKLHGRFEDPGKYDGAEHGRILVRNGRIAPLSMAGLGSSVHLRLFVNPAFSSRLHPWQ